LPMRLNIHGGAKIQLSSKFNLTPQLIYLHQGEDYGAGRAHEFVGSLYGQYMLTNQSDLLFGVNYRAKDAIIPFVGFHLGDFTLGLSYDVNTSDLDVASSNQGGIEISLSYIRHKRIVDPRFICPRL
ncbi:MAG TPA: type IX secretion system membrane protein PorP/SprF, partial [Chitinophagaceae bacterium]|nr:type IX secretion system membrane protein PorP/SprF [Chitinophagaceae bacterium]